MAKYTGLTCDKCNDHIVEGTATKVTVKIDGKEISGTYEEDWCMSCTEVPPGVTLKPLRRRGDSVPPMAPVQTGPMSPSPGE